MRRRAENRLVRTWFGVIGVGAPLGRRPKRTGVLVVTAGLVVFGCGSDTGSVHPDPGNPSGTGGDCHDYVTADGFTCCCGAAFCSRTRGCPGRNAGVGGVSGSGGSGAHGGFAGGVDSGPPPQCGWSAELDACGMRPPYISGTANFGGKCIATRTAVQANGLASFGVKTCLADEPKQCPPNWLPYGEIACDPSEYAVGCGPVTASRSRATFAATLSPACRALEGDYYDDVFFCCPCAAEGGRPRDACTDASIRRDASTDASSEASAVLSDAAGE